MEALRKQMESLADQWDPDSGIDSFGTGSKENAARGDYFLESASKVHFFAETTALEDGKLKPEFAKDKMSALNKSGHAMHMIPGAFQGYALSDEIRELVLDLGWKDPVVPQVSRKFCSDHEPATMPVLNNSNSSLLNNLNDLLLASAEYVHFQTKGNWRYRNVPPRFYLFVYRTETKLSGIVAGTPRRNVGKWMSLGTTKIALGTTEATIQAQSTSFWPRCH